MATNSHMISQMSEGTLKAFWRICWHKHCRNDCLPFLHCQMLDFNLRCEIAFPVNAFLQQNGRKQKHWPSKLKNQNFRFCASKVCASTDEMLSLTRLSDFLDNTELSCVNWQFGLHAMQKLSLLCFVALSHAWKSETQFSANCAWADLHNIFVATRWLGRDPNFSLSVLGPLRLDFLHDRSKSSVLSHIKHQQFCSQFE